MNRKTEQIVHLAASVASLVSFAAAAAALVQGRLLIASLWMLGLLLIGGGGGLLLLLARRPWMVATRPARLRFSWRRADALSQSLGFRKPRYSAPTAQTLGPQQVAALRGRVRSDSKLTIVFEDDAVGPMHRQGVPALIVSKEAAGGSHLATSIEEFLDRAVEASIGYVVTPSRMSMPSEAGHLYRMAMKALQERALVTGLSFRTILRIDSCLRGHIASENDSILQALEEVGRKGFELLLVAPAYVEQGRFTLDGVQYLQDERGRLRVDESEYARFTGFEFRDSDLALWLEAKTNGRIPRSRVYLVPVSHLRERTVESIAEELNALPSGTAVVIDIVNGSDAIAAAAVSTELEESRSVLYRAGPSLIDALTRREDDDASPSEFIARHYTELGNQPGLFVAGSLTSRTKIQIQELQNSPNVSLITFDNDEIATTAQAIGTASAKARKIDECFRAGHHVILTTGFWLSDKVEYPGEQVRSQVLEVFAAILRVVQERAGWVVFKGSDTGCHGMAEGLGALSVDYLGPLFPGAGLARLNKTGNRARYDGPVALVAGNVGSRTALVDIVTMFEGARLVRVT